MLKKRSWLDRIFSRGLQLMLVGSVTGLFVGIIVTFYNVAATFIEHCSVSIYEAVRATPAFIPLLFVCLVGGAFIIGVVLKLMPILRGSGVPQVEGASRGWFRFRWWDSLLCKAAISLFTIFLGVTAGPEGPSIFMGGAIGQGVGKALHRSGMEQRYQLTAGACAGIAVAFHAPLTGLIFAVEEAHRRFTPDIFISAFSSVLVAVLTRDALYTLLNMEVTSAFTHFALDVTLHWSDYGFVALIALAAGFLGVAFYHLSILFVRLFHKITWIKGVGKMTIPLVLAGVCGLITTYSIGGGHDFMEALGTGGGANAMTLTDIFGSPIVITILIIVLIRILTTAVNVGAGIPAGVFIPVLAIGAGIGALISQACLAMGMEAVYSDLIVMIGMSAFFATVVKAPFTAIIMVIELTGSFSPLLPVVLGVAIAYLIGSLFRTKPFYDVLLEFQLEETEHLNTTQTAVVTVEAHSVAEGAAIRDILWPCGVLVERVERNGETVLAHSDTVLKAGDHLTVLGEYETQIQLLLDVEEIVQAREKEHKSLHHELYGESGEKDSHHI